MKTLKAAAVGLLALAALAGPAMAENLVPSTASAAVAAKPAKAKAKAATLKRVGAEKGRTSELSETTTGLLIVGGVAAAGALAISELDEDESP
jgi:hypothetical protein